ncbi:hypothetical protein [Nonomuraea gerenzanensis]|uniref:Putative membrane protein n=1 Tax=Nonomuraea gerenzanensis TaxID=93944 RepID=A0A1M4E6M6_9ACTN|nr:hypothetical protein [Nonomuraea gerenzanensis]UBU16789.1 hypothetical protein LCN96_17755 [Nonomuraea gerenzanensis]SBO94499.1 putative membrane protein [Nonomuraea gerenzanensis]
MTPQSDEDEVWRQIVASFNDTAERDSADQPWPDSENVPAEPTRRVVRPPEEEPAQHGTALDDGPLLDRSDGDDEEEDEGHFEPPPPPPLPKLDLPTKLAWVALFGGPAYLLVAAMASWHMEGWALFTAVAAFIGGFVALVVRMGDGPPNDSGWDDGAVL